MKLTVEKSAKTINAQHMKDGDIGVIVSSVYHPDKIGRLVQRYKNNLITVGKHSENGWTDFFIDGCLSFDVRLLGVGDVIHVEE